VGIVVDELEAATAFFVELGLELQGQGQVEGGWVDRVVGLEGVRMEFAMVATPDGHGRLELVKFHSPSGLGGDRHAPANTQASAISHSESTTSTRAARRLAALRWAGGRDVIGRHSSHVLALAAS
jgi:hypothetical protein